ncbi:MFS transporter [Nonomuraea sp. KM88]|uniref:MFS transporter n=1 Tax=Nonomuraea sp. KM88 TaxID=3457427 RepID=UPI003FCE2EB5
MLPALGSIITAIDNNIVYVALPAIGHELGFSAQTLQWVVSAYAVIYGGFLLLGGRMSDLLGRRRMFLLGLGLFAVASLVGGLANAPELLIAARAVQGLGGAVLFPATLALVTSGFTEGSERNRALSVWAGAGASGLVLGSLLGGVLTQTFGWEAVFYVNVPIAVAGIVLALLLLPVDERRRERARVDYPGALSATGGVTLLVLALVQGPEIGWGSPAILSAAIVGVLLLAAFVVIQARTDEPLMPPRLLRHRNLAVGVLLTFAFAATFLPQLYFATVYFQSVHGYDALRTGAAFLVPMAGAMVGSSQGARLTARLGNRRTLLLGLALGTAGAAWFGLAMSVTGTYLAVAAGLLLVGLGQGTVYSAVFAAASVGVPGHDQGVASGMASTGLQVGSAVGLAVLVALANAGRDGLAGQALRVAITDGLRTAVFIAAAGMAASMLIALGFREEGARRVTA